MLHRVGGCAVALALLLPTWSAASAETAVDARDRAAATSTRTVELGHRPVVTSADSTVRLVFRGKRGQLVNLARWGGDRTCGARTLKVRGGARVQPWAPGYWKLRKDATYVASNKACASGDESFRVQVRRVVQHDRAVPGRETTIGKRTHVTHLVPLFVGAGQRVGLEPSTTTVQVLGPDRRSFVGADASTVLRDAGRHWVELEPRSTLTTTLTLEQDAVVDGTAITIPRRGTSDTTREVTFAGTADQWVYLELLDASGAIAGDTGRDVRVWGPDGREVEKVVLHTCPARRYSDCTTNGPWLLPTTGTYRMTLVPDMPATESTVTLRLRAAVVAPALTVDGPTRTYVATTPGQWVISRYTDTGTTTGARVESSNASAALGSWTFTMAPMFPWSLNCDEYRDGIGCDEYFRVQLRPDRPTAQSLGWATPDAWALLVVPPGGQGSVDVRLTTSGPQP